MSSENEEESNSKVHKCEEITPAKNVGKKKALVHISEDKLKARMSALVDAHITATKMALQSRMEAIKDEISSMRLTARDLTQRMNQLCLARHNYTESLDGRQDECQTAGSTTAEEDNVPNSPMVPFSHPASQQTTHVTTQKTSHNIIADPAKMPPKKSGAESERKGSDEGEARNQRTLMCQAVKDGIAKPRNPTPSSPDSGNSSPGCATPPHLTRPHSSSPPHHASRSHPDSPSHSSKLPHSASRPHTTPLTHTVPPPHTTSPPHSASRPHSEASSDLTVHKHNINYRHGTNSPHQSNSPHYIQSPHASNSPQSSNSPKSMHSIHSSNSDHNLPHLVNPSHPTSPSRSISSPVHGPSLPQSAQICPQHPHGRTSSHNTSHHSQHLQTNSHPQQQTSKSTGFIDLTREKGVPSPTQVRAKVHSADILMTPAQRSPLATTVATTHHIAASSLPSPTVHPANICDSKVRSPQTTSSTVGSQPRSPLATDDQPQDLSMAKRKSSDSLEREGIISTQSNSDCEQATAQPVPSPTKKTARKRTSSQRRSAEIRSDLPEKRRCETPSSEDRPVNSPHSPSNKSQVFKATARKRTMPRKVSSSEHQSISSPSDSQQKPVIIHPAALPSHPGKQPQSSKLPPKPTLVVRRVQGGVSLSWDMRVTSHHDSIKHYELYAYHEGAHTDPTLCPWKKAGEIEALQLPMACTLTQLQGGNRFHFAVRAVDKQRRAGPFSDPNFVHLRS